MNTLGYVWRDNAICLSSSLDPHADFIYGGGAVTGHGVVLAEAHGSFAQSVSDGRIGGEARRKYLRQVKPHVGGTCPHGKVIHGYAVAFGSHPAGHGTYLHVAETRISKVRKKAAAAPAPPARSAPVSTPLALAAHRSNFLLMGAYRIVAWADWLRGVGSRPDDDFDSAFFIVELSGRRYWVSMETLLPYLRPWLVRDERDWPWHWDDFERWRHMLGAGPHNVFAMEELAGKSFLMALSAMIGRGRGEFAGSAGPAGHRAHRIAGYGDRREPRRRRSLSRRAVPGWTCAAGAFAQAGSAGNACLGTEARHRLIGVISRRRPAGNACTMREGARPSRAFRSIPFVPPGDVDVPASRTAHRAPSRASP